jgi:hypothetical protein
VAVNLFGAVDPEHFEVFDKAFITLFFVTAGDPWPESLPKLREDGSADWVTAGYVIIFTVTVVWIFVEVERPPQAPLLTQRFERRGVRVFVRGGLAPCRVFGAGGLGVKRFVAMGRDVRRSYDPHFIGA